MRLILSREPTSHGATIGELRFVGQPERICYTLEDPVREAPGVPVAEWKKWGITAIPAGEYEVWITYSNRFKRMLPLLLNVPGFSGIRIHSGNTAEDTTGCIIVGMERDGNTVLRSREAERLIKQVITEGLAEGAVFLTIGNA